MSSARAAPYISAGFLYSFENSRLLTVLFYGGEEENINKWFSTNYNVKYMPILKTAKYCVVK